MTNSETGWRRSISRILALNCRDAAPLVSAAMDEPLSRADRWALRLHLVVCAPCRRYRRQLASIRSILTDLGRRAGEDAQRSSSIMPACAPFQERLITLGDTPSVSWRSIR